LESTVDTMVGYSMLLKSNCDLCNKLEFEKNLQEQKGSWLCPSCYNTYDDEELEEKLQSNNQS
tara:strand:+ start:209 stop:397 length:189 start_codon:yes stop_codon:yes gene_type:complete